MAHTWTGSLPIGFRRGGSAWQKNLEAVIDFARREGFKVVDVGALPIEQLRQIRDAGLGLGSVDLKQPWADLASPDAAKRQAAAEINAQYIAEAAALGARNFFTVVFPGDDAHSRKESFDFAVEGYGLLCRLMQQQAAKARLVIEGYPGGWPRFPALVCTPETYRALINAMPDGTCGVNYDPSHLVRMGIDPLRFLQEFVQHVYHVHAKDTQILHDALYEFGHLQQATFAPTHGFGGHTWRYTIPGHGVTPWSRVLSILAEAGYDGAVSVELEDERFMNTPENEQRGLVASLQFLQHA